MLLHDEVEDGCDNQDNDHDDCLRFAGYVVVGISDKEEKPDEGDFENKDTGEELREGVVEEEAMGVNLIALDEVVVVSVGYPEEAECERDYHQH